MDRTSQQLSQYASAISYDSLPEPVVHEIKRRVIDTLGCGIGAFLAEPCKMARSLAVEVLADPGASLLGTGQRTSPEMAAFANGLMVRYLDYNDTYLSREPCHPSDTIPAVLAAAQAHEAGGRQVIAAVVLSYEVLCRLCDAAGIRLRGWDHVTYGVIACALGAGKVLELSQEELAHAVALAAAPNAAMRQTRVGLLSMWKGAAFANASRNGVFAARLAQRGMTGPDKPFEGPMGFWSQVSGPFELEDAFGGQGGAFKVLETSLKAFPAEYHSQCAIEAALSIREELPGIDTIASVVVEACDAAVDIIADTPDKWHPQTRETADHSLPYIVAAALMDGAITPTQFAPERLEDPGLQALVQKVEVSRSDEFSRAYPSAHPARVHVTTTSGATYVRELSYAWGHPQNPMSDAEVEEKFRRVTGDLLAPWQKDAALEALWHLEEVDDLEEVFSLLTV